MPFQLHGLGGNQIEKGPELMFLLGKLVVGLQLLVQSLYLGMVDWRLAGSLLGHWGLVWISSVEVIRLLFSGFVGKSLRSAIGL